MIKQKTISSFWDAEFFSEINQYWITIKSFTQKPDEKTLQCFINAGRYDKGLKMRLIKKSEIVKIEIEKEWINK